MSAHTTPLPAATLKVALSALAKDIKLAHSVFALPFAVLGAFLALQRPINTGRLAGQLALIILCMVFARSWAMLINRLADRHFDAKNPRTARRALASGSVHSRTGWLIAWCCALGFIAATGLFLLFFSNPWPIALSLPVLLWLGLYSYTKRFSALCHLFLGSALAASPIAAALAIEPRVVTGMLPGGLAIWLLAGFVMLWVAGFDIIYALQDFAFDRANRLSSIPAWLGPDAALWVSRVLHLGAAALLWSAWRTSDQLSTLFSISAALASGLLMTEHVIARNFPRTLSPDSPPPPALNMAFFTLNGVVSLLLGIAGVADCL